MTRKRISLLGSTGSIGTNTLDLVRRFPERFEIVGLAAGQNHELLAAQIREFRPSIVSMKGEEDRRRLAATLKPISSDLPEILIGTEGISAVATSDCDLVVSALVGVAGLLPTWAALKKGTPVALANKETLVAGGPLIRPLIEKNPDLILPLDSEHSAIFQCLAGHPKKNVHRLILTASGGPFYGKKRSDLEQVTVEDALNHPVWKMGHKISIDSATMMNKGLEVIEARWLFDFPPSQIDVLIHPQSQIHSLVEFKDGSILAQIASPDMRGPISYALECPERLPLPFNRSNPLEWKSWNFFPAQRGDFPCLDMAYEALNLGGSAGAILNAANEAAVGAFLSRKIRFLDIPKIIRSVLDRTEALGGTHPPESIDEILSINQRSRLLSDEAIQKIGNMVN